MIWDAIFRYFPELQSRLSFGPESINDPINVITLEGSIHQEFGQFLISLEASVSFLSIPRCPDNNLPRTW